MKPTQDSLAVGLGDIKVPQASKLYEELLVPLHSSWSGAMSSEEAYDTIIKNWQKVLAE